MMGSTDMSTPVTRGDLHAAIAPLATKAEIVPLATKAELQEAVARLATKAELESCFEALLAHIESREQRLVDQIGKRIDGVEQRLLTELARHTNAVFEAMSGHIAVIDDKYKGLPERVSRLERTVFTDKLR